MRPTPDQIQRARLVSLWRRRATREPGTFWHQYDPYGAMHQVGLAWHGDGADVWAARPDILEANVTSSHVPNRIIVNPPRPRPTPPDLETADDFPY